MYGTKFRSTGKAEDSFNQYEITPTSKKYLNKIILMSQCFHLCFIFKIVWLKYKLAKNKYIKEIYYSNFNNGGKFSYYKQTKKTE